MSYREPYLDDNSKFLFSKELLTKAEAVIAKYPAGRQRSAVMPILDMVQRSNKGWLSVSAMNAVAELLDMPYIKVYEVASFYTMYNLKPVGKYLLQICRTTPCWLRGSDKLLQKIKDKLSIKVGETSADDLFTLVEVECLGACVNAPMIQINDNYYEDLNEDILDNILEDLKQGKQVKVGTQINRQNSAPKK